MLHVQSMPLPHTLALQFALNTFDATIMPRSLLVLYVLGTVQSVLCSTVRCRTSTLPCRNNGYISTRLTRRAVKPPLSYFTHYYSIPMVTHIRIDVFSHEGKALIGKKHEISFGGEGLLAVAQRLGYKAENLLCFRIKEEALDETNMGAPLSSVCAILRPDMGN